MILKPHQLCRVESALPKVINTGCFWPQTETDPVWVIIWWQGHLSMGVALKFSRRELFYSRSTFILQSYEISVYVCLEFGKGNILHVC
jgi:hypothetical protein